MTRVLVLGCGASGGVPMIGCKCQVCTSTNPKNKRTRVSLYIETGGQRILIDTAPDLRQQALRENITAIDAIIYTHAHADHLHGIDDLRSFNYAKNAPIDAYAAQDTIDTIRQRFDYTLLPPKPAQLGWFRPCLNPVTIEPYKQFNIGDVSVLPFEQKHGMGKTIGLRIGNFAYSTDTNGLSDKALDALIGIDIWVVDCLRYEEAPSHAHLAMTLGWIEKVKPRQAYLTHMHHGFEYDKLASELPPNVFPAHDGLELTL